MGARDSSVSRRLAGGPDGVAPGGLARMLWAGLVLLLAPACEQKPASFLVPNLPPVIELSAAPLEGDSTSYLVRFRWFGFDPDGEIAHYAYATDPPALGDTAWVLVGLRDLTLRFSATEPGTSPTGTIVGRGYHVFVLRAVDNEGLPSAPVHTAFTAETVAPLARISFPTPSRLLTASTRPSIRIQFTGTDPDGSTDQRPVKYLYRLVPLETIQQGMGLPDRVRPNAAEVQEFLIRDAPEFAGWDSTGAESSFVDFVDLTPARVFYLAVTAVDEAGAYDPVFDMDRNVLCMQAMSFLVPPRITIWTDYFLYEQVAGGIDPSEQSVRYLTVPAASPTRIEWSAAITGGEIVGYRWVLDPEGGVFDETPREDDSQTYRWSDWSVVERSLVLGPYSPPPGEDELHRLYVQAKDNSGAVSMVAVEVRGVARSRTLLVVDDFRGEPDRDYGPGDPASYQPYGIYPTEAVLDTFLFAVGGKPYRYRAPGTLSRPGMFSGFEYDTLDYRFIPQTGVPLDVLLRYQVVVWFTGLRDALHTRRSPPMAALRYVCTPGEINTLELFVRLGGKVWLFGDGILQAIYYGEENIEYVHYATRIPRAGTFLYEYLKLRSQFDFSGSRTAEDALLTQTPYLPVSATPGRAWPPDTTRAYARGECDDPRVGPAAARNLARWDGLPCIHINTDPTDWSSPLPTTLVGQAYVSKPLLVSEDLDPGPGVRNESTLDTLYLYHSMGYLASPRVTYGDGKPVMFSYWGPSHGAVVWSTMPLWMFDREEVRQLAERVLAQLGVQKQQNPALWTGPGSAHLGSLATPTLRPAHRALP